MSWLRSKVEQDATRKLPGFFLESCIEGLLLALPLSSHSEFLRGFPFSFMVLICTDGGGRERKRALVNHQHRLTVDTHGD